MWAKLDDEAWMNAKLQDTSQAGITLWTMTMSRCGHDNTEGRVTARIERQTRALFGVKPSAAAELVERGLWHDAKTIRRCATCRKAAGKLEPGEHYFHDWLDYQFTRDEATLPEHRVKAIRNKRLSRNPELREQVYLRDRGLCRYCGCRPDFADRRTGNGGTWDHLDPSGPNTLDNVVVACRRCNSLKNDRTPEEAGMTLLSVPGQTEDRPRSDGGPPTRGRTREFGTGRAGDTPRSDPGQIPEDGAA